MGHTFNFNMFIFYLLFSFPTSLLSCASPLPPPSPLLTCASRLGGPCLPLTRAANMLRDWLSSRVARLVVNSMPPTFSSTRSGQVLGGAGMACPLLVEGSSSGKRGSVAAAAVARRSTLQGGLLLLPLPASCPRASATGGSPLVLYLAALGRATQFVAGRSRSEC